MESLGGQLAAAPSAVSWGPNRVDVFAAGPGNTPWHWFWNGALWAPPAPLPGANIIPAVGVSSVSLGPNLLDVFAAGTRNTPWWWRWDGSTWSPPQPLPSGANLPAEGIAAVSPRPNRLDLFAPGAGNHLWHWWQEGSPTWHVEDLAGNLPAERVTVASWGPSRMDVFAASRGGSGNPLQHWWWDGTAFHGPESLGGDLIAASVSAVARAPNRLDVFGISGDAHLVRWRWDGIGWIGPNPRGINLPAGDVSAVVTGLDQIHVFARGADNTLQHWPGGGVGSCSNDSWTNFAGNQVVASPVGHCHPGSLEELIAIVKEAEQRGCHVRAVGSSWSFSDVAVTPDYIVETDLLNSLVTEVLSATPSVLNSRGSALKLLHVEAGIRLVDLNILLDQRYLALRTMGGSSGQTLAGALSTSVHGADIDRGPLPDIVRAIHLVGPGGIQHWIEPAAGITDPTRLSAALGLDPVNIHYDDDWFNSVLVSVGTMGIIYSLIVEVVDQYDLVEDCQHLSWEALRATLVRGDPFVGKRCVQVAVNPFKVPYPGLSNPTHPCYLITRTEATKTLPDPGGGDGFAQLWHWLGAVITAAMIVDPNLIETTVTKVTNDALPQGRKQGFAHTIMATPDPPPARGLGLEMAFDATNDAYLSFVDEALQILETAYQRDHLALGGWFSLRFVGQSRAYLSPQHQFTRTCMVETVGLGLLPSTKPILDLLESAGRRHGGIQHWGMFYNMASRDVRRAFKDLDKWLGVRALLTNGGTVHTFDSPFAERSGLTGLRPSVLLSDDYDGDGKTDLAVWRPHEGNWYIINSSNGAQRTIQWGADRDIPVPGDYDGDGKTDLAVWRPHDGNWWLVDSATGLERTIQWGLVGDIPVPGDYDGDGKTDLAVWRPHEGNWYIINSSNGAQRTIQWGADRDIPVPGDYDGDGKTDLAVWRPHDGNWWLVDSATGLERTIQWGLSGDVPV